MKKKIVLSVVMVFLFSLFLIPNKIYAEEMELETEILEVTSIDFAAIEEDFITYMSDTYGMNFRAADSSKLSYTISFGKSSTEVYITLSVYSVGGYASEVGIKNVYLRAYVNSSTYTSQSADGFYSTNTFSSAGGYIITNPVKGYAYQLVGTLYTIIDNVEYTYDITSSKYTF